MQIATGSGTPRAAAPGAAPAAPPAPAGRAERGGGFAQALARASSPATTTAPAEAPLAERRAAARDVMRHLPPPYVRQLATEGPGTPAPAPEFDILFRTIDSGEMTLNASQRTGTNVYAHMLRATAVFDSPEAMWNEMRAMLGAPAAIETAVAAAHAAPTAPPATASPAAAPATAATATPAAGGDAAEAPGDVAAAPPAAGDAVFAVLGGRPDAALLEWWDQVLAMLTAVTGEPLGADAAPDDR